jgi:hypothetical protein
MIGGRPRTVRTGPLAANEGVAADLASRTANSVVALRGANTSLGGDSTATPRRVGIAAAC